jgi:hypothetical protein
MERGDGQVKLQTTIQPKMRVNATEILSELSDSCPEKV